MRDTRVACHSVVMMDMATVVGNAIATFCYDSYLGMSLNGLLDFTLSCLC